MHSATCRGGGKELEMIHFGVEVESNHSATLGEIPGYTHSGEGKELEMIHFGDEVELRLFATTLQS